MLDAEPDANGEDGSAIEGGPLDAIKALIAEAQAAAASETALLQACGVIVAASLKAMSLWAIIALFCAFVGLLAFAIGAVIALAQWTGAVAAMLIVPAALFFVAAIGAWRARSHLRMMGDAVGTLRS
ncbi:MAG: phage holin family protein [Sphingopyxis sp.]